MIKAWYHCVSDRCSLYHKEIDCSKDTIDYSRDTIPGGYGHKVERCKECGGPLRYARPSKTRQEMMDDAIAFVKKEK